MSSADDFLTGGSHDVQPSPPGPAPTGPYEYLPVARSMSVPGVLPEMRAIYFFIESFLLSAGYAERLDLINQTRIYRMEIKYLWRVGGDSQGPFVRTPLGLYRFVLEDPSIGFKAMNEWAPVGL